MSHFSLKNKKLQTQIFLIAFFLSPLLSHSQQEKFGFGLEDLDRRGYNRYMRFYRFLEQNPVALKCLKDAKNGIPHRVCSDRFEEMESWKKNDVHWKLLEATSKNSNLTLGLSYRGVGAGIDVIGYASDLKKVYDDQKKKRFSLAERKETQEIAEYFTLGVEECRMKPKSCRMRGLVNENNVMTEVLPKYFSGFFELADPEASHESYQLLKIQKTERLDEELAKGIITKAQYDEEKRNMEIEEEYADLLSDYYKGLEEHFDLQDANKDELHQSAQSEYTAVQTEQISKDTKQISKNTEQISKQIKQLPEETKKNITEAQAKLFADLDKKHKEEFEEAQRLKRLSIKKSDPLFTGRSRFEMAKEEQFNFYGNEIKINDQELADGKITKAEHNERRQQYDNIRKKIKNSVINHRLQKSINNSQAWIRATQAGWNTLGLPGAGEIDKVFTVFIGALEFSKHVEPMLINSVLDPTGITGALGAVNLMMSALSNTPTHEQMVAKQLFALRSRQVEILSDLKKIDHKIDGINQQLDKIINILNLNHEQIMGGVEDIQEQIKSTERKLLRAIRKSVQMTKEAGRRLDADLRTPKTTIVVELEEGDHLNDKIAECQRYWKEHKETRVIDFLHEYNRCIDTVNERYNNLINQFKDTEIKIEDFSGDFYVTKKPKNLIFELEKDEPVEDKVGLLYYIVDWIYDKSYKKIQKEKIEDQEKDEEEEIQKNLEKYKNLLHDPDLIDQFAHPSFFDEAFPLYFDIIELLPNPSNLKILKPSHKGYKDKHIARMCTTAHFINSIEAQSRNNLPVAWSLSLSIVKQIAEELKQSMIDYKENTLANFQLTQKNLAQNNCDCEEDNNRVFKRKQDAIKYTETIKDYTKAKIIRGNK